MSRLHHICSQAKCVIYANEKVVIYLLLEHEVNICICLAPLCFILSSPCLSIDRIHHVFRQQFTDQETGEKRTAWH